MKCSGPTDARIAILTDYPSAGEYGSQLPLSDYAGKKLTELLSRRGLLASSMFVLSVLDKPLPDDDVGKHISPRKTCPGPDWASIDGKWISPELALARQQALARLAMVRPTLVIALGDLSLWTLTGNLGISKWRGSRLQAPGYPFQVLPMLSPRILPRDPTLSYLFQIDISRAKAIFEGTQQPREYEFVTAPSFETAEACLKSMLSAIIQSPDLSYISLDLETRSGHIACIGLAPSATEALCLPLITVDDASPFYWTEDQESRLIFLIAEILLHPRVITIGQNISYDCQYLHRHWGFVPREVRDTMIGHHSIFANMRKGLDFLSSMYAQDHVYWKEESKDWDPKIGELQYWIYNCKDCCITWEVWFEIWGSVEEKNLQEHALFQQKLFFPVLRMMNRGIRIDTSQRAVLRGELLQAQFARQESLDYVAGHPLNPRSPKQLSDFFYHDLGIPGVKNLTTDALTTNSPAMSLIAQRQPALRPLCQLIVELRSIGVFLSTFIDAKLDTDDRMRCSFNIAGTETYRFSSRENAFNSGMNLQNIPVAEKAKIKSDTYVKLPNIRKLFIPDPGYTFFDMDLDRADLQVVVWEADDQDLKSVLRQNLDMHCVNACDIFDLKGIPREELQETHPNYRDHRARIGEAFRNKSKAGVHATNYGVGDRKLAEALGITVHEASRFRARWFAAHPGIRRWHLRIEDEATKRGFISTRFGARMYTLGRIDLPQLLAWQPQSTVAGVINRALLNIDEAAQKGATSVQLLIQVHDSLAGQFRTIDAPFEVAMLKKLARVPIPYEDPLIIPVGINTSGISWGHCK